MAAKHSSIAKITRPSISGTLERKRLFRSLDKGLAKPFIWISGPPGSGKTTLVASYLTVKNLPCIWYQMDEGDADSATFFYYLGLAAKKAAPRNRKPLPLLTPEYLHGIITFTKRYFEDLCGRLKPPVALVFDNYQKVPPDAAFHEIVWEGLSIVPEGIKVILISRSEPPPALVLLRAANKINFLGWNEIRLTQEESKEIIRLYGREKISDVLFKELYNRTQGWAAGLMLFLEQTRQMDVGPELISKIAELSYEGVFDYFAGEIFNSTDKETQEFLLKTAFPQRITAQIAEQLTGLKQASRILTDLNKRNYFIIRHVHPEPVYQYHPLFREFLLSRSEILFEKTDISQMQRRAASLLQKSGQIEDAVELFCKAEDWGEVAALINRQALSLLAQGRSLTVKGWLDRMPDAAIEQSPYLLYWRGACLMTFNPLLSRKDFERAFALFRAQEDPLGLCLSWEGVVNTYIYSIDDYKPLDDWIRTFEEVIAPYSGFPSPDIELHMTSAMFYALLWRRPYHDAIGPWVERLEQLVEKTSDIGQRIMIGSYLSTYYMFMGSHSKLAFLQNLLRPQSRSAETAPLAEILWHSFEAVYYWLKVLPLDALASANHGIAKANSTGVHLVDFSLYTHGTYAALLAGDFQSADEYLGKLAAITNGNRRLELGYYYYARGFAALLREDFPAALLHAEKALRLTLEVGAPAPEAMCRIGLAQVHLELKNYKQAGVELAHAHRISSGMRSKWFEYLCSLGEAQSALDQKDEAGGIAFLQKALVLGRAEGYMNHEWRRPAVMTRLCEKALEAGIEVEYVQDLIRKRGLVAESPPLHLENWPWALKIHTLGRFGMIKDGKPVAFQGKIQKKPLDMLKALIASGGRDVSEVQLTDALWPDAAGDAAHSAFSTTLQRLRQSVGSEKAVQLKEGKVTLDARYCWVDAWAFERTLNDVESLLQDKESKKAIELLEKAVSLYRGDFLGGDTNQPWAISMHERLRSKFIRAVARLGRSWEEKGRWGEAVRWYLKGLDVDSITEEFYQGLMRCYQKLGRKAEALGVYERCRKTLSSVLGVEPSSVTESVCRNIKG
jgi:LuxR family maltose regulon positive regulatory protein